MAVKNSEDKSLRQVVGDSFAEIKENILEMAQDVLSIKNAISGDKYGNEGLVKKQRDNEERISKLEQFNWKLIGIFTGFSIINVLVALIIKYL